MPKITVHLRLQKLFQLIQIIHQHLYLLLESSKKMSAVVHPTKFFEYFDNLIDTGKAFQPYSVSVARSIHHITKQIKGHSNNYKCYCFLCWICWLLIVVLLFRKYEKLLCIIKENNYLTITNEDILRIIQQKNNKCN